MVVLVKTVINDVESVWEKSSVTTLMDLVSTDVNLATKESGVPKVRKVYCIKLKDMFML